MEALSEALNSALEQALTAHAPNPLSREELVSKTRGDIEAAVLEALQNKAVIDAMQRPEFVQELVCDMAAAGKCDRMIGALQRGGSPNYQKSNGGPRKKRYPISLSRKQYHYDTRILFREEENSIADARSRR